MTKFPLHINVRRKIILHTGNLHKLKFMTLLECWELVNSGIQSGWLSGQIVGELGTQLEYMDLAKYTRKPKWDPTWCILGDTKSAEMQWGLLNSWKVWMSKTVFSHFNTLSLQGLFLPRVHRLRFCRSRFWVWIWYFMLNLRFSSNGTASFRAG